MSEQSTTITREPAAAVTYWHVELDAHDVLIAEGVPARSDLDRGDRPFVDEASAPPAQPRLPRAGP